MGRRETGVTIELATPTVAHGSCSALRAYTRDHAVRTATYCTVYANSRPPAVHAAWSLYTRGAIAHWFANSAHLDSAAPPSLTCLASRRRMVVRRW